MSRDRLAGAIGVLLIAGAELTYLGLAIYLVITTKQSQHLKTPNVSGVVVGMTGALAGAFGAGFAALLGVPAATTTREVEGRGVANVWRWVVSALTANNVIAIGVLTYLCVGAALGLTYLIWEVESPGIVKTIAIAFGGYVIAYVGKAVSEWAGS